MVKRQDILGGCLQFSRQAGAEALDALGGKLMQIGAQGFQFRIKTGNQDNGNATDGSKKLLKLRGGEGRMGQCEFALFLLQD